MQFLTSRPGRNRLAALCLSVAMPVWGGVTLPNTRVIYPGGAAAHTVQVSNSSDSPYVVQIWADIANPLSTPEQADAPFLISPALFRIDPDGGQSVRIVYSGDIAQLPADKETIFYLNMVQTPPRNSALAGQNQLKVILRDRLKLFYRPATIKGTPTELPQRLQFRFKAPDQLLVTNTSPWFASVVKARVQLAGQWQELDLDMIAPGASRSWRWPLAVSALPLPLHFSLINDYGGITEAQTTLSIAVPKADLLESGAGFDHGP